MIRLKVGPRRRCGIGLVPEDEGDLHVRLGRDVRHLDDDGLIDEPGDSGFRERHVVLVKDAHLCAGEELGYCGLTRRELVVASGCVDEAVDGGSGGKPLDRLRQILEFCHADWLNGERSKRRIAVGDVALHLVDFRADLRQSGVLSSHFGYTSWSCR